jgi:hypothetical protein
MEYLDDAILLDIMFMCNDKDWGNLRISCRRIQKLIDSINPDLSKVHVPYISVYIPPIPYDQPALCTFCNNTYQRDYRYNKYNEFYDNGKWTSTTNVCSTDCLPKLLKQTIDQTFEIVKKWTFKTFESEYIFGIVKRFILEYKTIQEETELDKLFLFYSEYVSLILIFSSMISTGDGKVRMLKLKHEQTPIENFKTMRVRVVKPKDISRFYALDDVKHRSEKYSLIQKNSLEFLKINQLNPDEYWMKVLSKKDYIPFNLEVYKSLTHQGVDLEIRFFLKDPPEI